MWKEYRTLPLDGVQHQRRSRRNGHAHTQQRIVEPHGRQRRHERMVGQKSEIINRKPEQP